MLPNCYCNVTCGLRMLRQIIGYFITSCSAACIAVNSYFNRMETHLHHPHEEQHLKSSDILKDVVIGMSDGLTVPFALAAGLSGAVDNVDLVVIAGIAEIAAGSIAMGLGGYLAGKTERDHYKSELRREYDEIEKVPHIEREEVREFFEGLGLSVNVQQQAVDELTKDKDRWANFMMKYELGLECPDPKRARKSAFNIGSLIS
jgi:hypothetical protein